MGRVHNLTSGVSIRGPISLSLPGVVYSAAPIIKNLVSNGTFGSDTVWSKPVDTSISGGTLNYNAPSTVATVFQEINITAGQSYQVSLEVIDYGTGNVRAALGGTAGVVRMASGQFTETLVAGSSNLRIAIVGSSGAVLKVDNVQVTPV